MSETARAYDGGGREHILPEATQDVVVKDAAGIDRKVFAGQPVPLDLLDAYNEATSAEAEEPAEAPKRGRSRRQNPEEQQEPASEADGSDEAAAAEASDEVEAGGDA